MQKVLRKKEKESLKRKSAANEANISQPDKFHMTPKKYHICEIIRVLDLYDACQQKKGGERSREKKTETATSLRLSTFFWISYWETLYDTMSLVRQTCCSGVFVGTVQEKKESEEHILWLMQYPLKLLRYGNKYKKLKKKKKSCRTLQES